MDVVKLVSFGMELELVGSRSEQCHLWWKEIGFVHANISLPSE
jgi:hypothetical protein